MFSLYATGQTRDAERAGREVGRGWRYFAGGRAPEPVTARAG